MTNCDIICTFVMIKLASCRKRSAACTVRSRPICSSQYSGIRPSNRANSGAPYTPSYGGRVGGCHTMGQGRRDSSGHHMTSSDTGSQPYCLTPLAIVPVHESRHEHQKVLLWKGPVQCRSSLHTLSRRGIPS